MIEIRVVLYGMLKEAAGASSFELRLPDESTIAELTEHLKTERPALSEKLESVAYAVDDRIVGPQERLAEGVSVALLPPVSGGSSLGRWITEAPLDLQALLEETEDHASGALAIFCGTVRHENDGQSVERMRYEAHQDLAERVLHTLEEDVIERFGVHRCRIQHRIGMLELGEPSVQVVVRAAHRDEAFLACRYAIDTLKAKAPIWKEEHYQSGDKRYLEGTPLATEEAP